VTDFINIVVQGIILGGIYALIALGLVLVYKATKVLNIAYGDIMMILGYFLCFFLTSLGFPLPVGLLVVFIIGVLIGLFLEGVIMRPLIGHGFLPMIMTTLFIALLIQGIVAMVWKNIDKPLSVIPKGVFKFWEISIPYSHLWAFFIALLIFLLLFAIFRYTKIGLAMRAVAEDHQISQSMGINVKRIFAISWAISGVTAAAAGMLLGNISIVGPELNHAGIAKAIPVLLLGGLESVPGALIGGIIIGVAELLGGWYAGSEYREIIPFALMLLILVIKPHGLFGLKTIERI